MKGRILYCAAFVALWVGLDLAGDRIAVNGLSSPWYPQAALGLALLLACGWNYFWLVPAAKLISSLIVWPGPLGERLLPTAIFAAGIALLGYLIQRFRRYEGRSLLIYGLLSALIVAAVGAPMAVFRQSYYHWLEGGGHWNLKELAQLSWENWLGDVTTILCLSPGLEMMMGGNLSRSLHVIKKTLREYWSVFLVLFALVLPLPFVPADLSYRAWYLFAFPCLVLAAFAGLEAAVMITFVTNVLLGTVAIAILPRVNIIDLQVFLLSINLVSLIVGAMVNESRQRLEELSRTANQALEAQFIKVRALMKIQNTMTEPLRALVSEAEKTETADLVSPAKQLLARLDSLSKQEKEPADFGMFPSKELVAEWQKIAREQTPAGAREPELTLAGPLPETIPADRAALRTIFRQLVNLVLQMQAPNTTPCIYISARAKNLLFRAEIKPSSAFSSSEIDFLGNPDHLPAGGYALTAFILHSLVRGLSGRMEIYPHYFSFREILVAEIRQPLGGGKGPS